MLTTLVEVDLEPFAEAKLQPEVVFERLPADAWLVPPAPMALCDTADAPAWALVDGGDLVRVPLFSYTTHDAQLSTLAGFACELGVRACLGLTQRPRRMYIALGRPAYPVDNAAGVAAHRFFLGFAFEINGRG